MKFNSLDPIDKSQLILDAISQKQQAISSNLANMNTPGYLRRDVDFAQILTSANSPLETKLSSKLGPSPSITSEGGEVNATKELIAMQKNMLDYTIATRRVSSAIQQLRTVSQVGK